MKNPTNRQPVPGAPRRWLGYSWSLCLLFIRTSGCDSFWGFGRRFFFGDGRSGIIKVSMLGLYPCIWVEEIWLILIDFRCCVCVCVNLFVEEILFDWFTLDVGVNFILMEDDLVTQIDTFQILDFISSGLRLSTRGGVDKLRWRPQKLGGAT